jgi:hypothetical protein
MNSSFEADASLAIELNEDSPLRAAILSGETKPAGPKKTPSTPPPPIIELGDGRVEPPTPRPKAPPLPEGDEPLSPESPAKSDQLAG